MALTFCHPLNHRETWFRCTIVSAVLSVTRLMPPWLKHGLGITSFQDRYKRYRKYSVRMFFRISRTAACAGGEHFWYQQKAPKTTVTQTNSFCKSPFPKNRKPLGFRKSCIKKVTNIICNWETYSPPSSLFFFNLIEISIEMSNLHESVLISQWHKYNQIQQLVVSDLSIQLVGKPTLTLHYKFNFPSTQVSTWD